MRFPHSFLRTCMTMLALVSIFIANLPVALGEEADDLQSKIDSHSAEIERLNAEIAGYQRELTTISGQANTLANQVKELDTTKKQLLTNIKLTEEKIKKAELDLVELGGEIEDKETTIGERGDLIAENIRRINEAGSVSFLELLLSEESFTNAWTSIDEVKSFQDAIREDVHTLSSAKTVLVTRLSDVEKKRQELLTLRASLADQQKIVDANVRDKNTLLAQTKNQESSYQKLVADRQALVASFEAEVRSYEEQLTYVLNPGSIPKVGSAPLAWPLASVVITQQFGRTVDSVRLYASGSHSGTDFRADVGTPLYAMADGVVSGVGDTDAACAGASFGKWVLISYDNHLASTYGHLSLIKAVNGQRVKRGDVIGYSGATGHVTGPHLHISLYPSDAVEVSGKESLACKGKILVQPRAATTAYLDPLAYMPATTPSMFK